MWSLYKGQQPYVLKAGVLMPNTLFPHFTQSAHPVYKGLAESCLRRDPHERPSFAELAGSLFKFFDEGGGVYDPCLLQPACRCSSHPSWMMMRQQLSLLQPRPGLLPRLPPLLSPRLWPPCLQPTVRPLPSPPALPPPSTTSTPSPHL